MNPLFRLLLGSLCVVVSATVVAQQTPTQKPAAAPDYFPNKKGTKWVYTVGKNAIDVVADVDGRLDTMVEGKTVAAETIEVKADGIYRTKVNSTLIEPAVKILSLPADKDATWNVNSMLNGQAIKGKFTQKAKTEKVKVAAGEFDCVVVDGPEFEIAGAKCGIRYYFADGKYVVKMIYSIAGNEAMLELKEFVPAK
jgi:hypothetical protein